MARTKIETGSKRVDTAPPVGEMRIVYEALAELVRWPRNPKEHDFDYLEASFERFGFAAPPTVDETSGCLVAGHGRIELLAALKAAGKPAPARIKVRDSDGEWLVPVLRGIAFRDAIEAEAWLVSDNEGAALGGWKERELLEMLESHRGNLSGTGFDEERVDDLAEKLRALADDVEVEIPETPERKTELAYEDRYALVVACSSEEDQKATFEKLRSMGLDAKVRYWRVAAKVTG